MQLYCKSINGILTVLAAHDDTQDVPPSAYGDGVVVLPYAGNAPLETLLGRPLAGDASSLTTYAAAKRYKVETAGITVNGTPIATDRESQTMINKAYAYVQASGAASVSYKSAAGFVTLTADQIKTVALAVGAHVQACFKAEDDADAAISAGTIKTTADVDAAFAGIV